MTTLTIFNSLEILKWATKIISNCVFNPIQPTIFDLFRSIIIITLCLNLKKKKIGENQFQQVLGVKIPIKLLLFWFQQFIFK